MPSRARRTSSAWWRPEVRDRPQDWVASLSLNRVGSILEQLVALPLAERKRVIGLHRDRAATIVAGTAILLVAMEEFGLDMIEVSEHDLLYGAAREAAAQL